MKVKTQLLCLSLVAFAPAHGQFNKFRSKTKLNNPAANSAKQLLNQNEAQEEEAPKIQIQGANGQKKDIFGRDTGINSASNLKSDKSFVNLNPETAFGPEVVTSFDFPDTSLEDLTKYMQKLSGINLILDSKGLKGKVSIIAPSAITVGDAWRAYITALEMNGYTLVKSGSFYKIVTTRDIRYTPTKIYTGNFTPDTDNYVMRIIPLKNINSTEVTRSFRPFMSRYGRLIDIKQTNTIIVQDTGSNINRLVRLIKFIDVPGYEESLQIIPVKNSSAQEIAKLLDEILKEDSKSSKFRKRNDEGENISKIIAEPRSNSIIAMANADGARQLRSLIEKLDISDIHKNGGRIHVYYLNHGTAEELSKTLSSLVSSSQSSSRASSRFSRRGAAAAVDSSDSIFNDDVKITADKNNNAIVITASPTDYLTLKEVIKKLDIPRDQVYVEGLIMETSVSRSNSLGVSLVGAYGKGALQRAGTNVNGTAIGNLLTNNITQLGGLFTGFGIGKTVTLTTAAGDVTVNTINGLISAIASNTSSNVLATPQILALDNQEATFESTDSIPTPETNTTPGGVTTTSTKEQKVGLTLKITPQINKVTRFVKLKIDQKIASFAPNSTPSGLQNLGLASNERAAVTTVVVRDKDTIAMGGLMRDESRDTVSKVPLLGDIPVLGWLFKTSTKEIDKVNLLFFLTPRILSNYQKDNADNMKDILNRRASHLEKTLGENDPNKTTTKGLYEKAKRQAEGPLYDEEEASKYRRSNEENGIDGMIEEDQDDLDVELSQDGFQVPNYQKILQTIKMKKAAVRK